MMKEFYDQFQPTVKDGEAMQKEKVEKDFRKDPKQVSRFCSFREIGPWVQIEKDDEEKNLPVYGRSKYWNYYLKKGTFLLPKDLGEYKGEEVQVSNGRYGLLYRHGAFCFFAKRRKPLDVDFKKERKN
jgi:DNA topoisomerase-1